MLVGIYGAYMKKPKLTQADKIINFCKDGDWHCQTEFWRNYIFSPHKRRSDIEKAGKYYFEERPCQHDITNSKDFRLRVNTNNYREVKYFVPELNKTIIKLERLENNY